MSRSSAVYADFLEPYLSSGTHLLDAGCGSGELTLDLAGIVGEVTGIDLEVEEIEAARQAATRAGVTNAHFEVADVYRLDFASDHFDAVLAHSVLEALDRPTDAIAEMTRVLRPGGILAAASVEYAGLVLAGPHQDLTNRFYAIRERLWQIQGADPYLGRELRRLLNGAGLVDVTATTTCITYGTAERVEEFGLGRAEDCDDHWYVTSAIRHGLANREELQAMRQAWADWAASSASYAAFAWCKALGWKP
jgi:ubiquinone/menaquinone biosynthesis C-methylase UbiE